MAGFSNPTLSKSVRWIIATIGIVVLVSVYGVWRTIDQKTGGGFWSGALRGALVFGGIGLLWAWAKRDSGKKSGIVSEQPPAAQTAPLQQRAPSAPTPASTAPTSVDEDAIYTTIAHELETGATDKGLWTRLFAECEGNENKTKAHYIRERAERLIAAERAVQPTPAQPVQPDRSNHPWRRFFARTVDLLFLAVPLYLAAFFGLLKILPDDSTKIVEILTNEVAAAIFAYWLWVPVEAWFLATFGATPAKWIFGIKVLAADGQKLTYPAALKRAASVCIFGDAFGIPVFALFSRAYAYDKLKKTGTTKWDGVAGSVVQHQSWGAGRVVATVLTVAVATVLFSMLNLLDKAQGVKVAAKAGQAQIESPSPTPQPIARASNEAEFSAVVASQAPRASTGQHFDEENYHTCLRNWHAKNRKEWVEYIKRKTDLNGKVKPSIYWPNDASACDTRAVHATQPEDDGSWGSVEPICFGGKYDETCDPELANLKRVSEGYISALDRGLADYQHCIQKWQGDHYNLWLDFKDRWRDPNRTLALKTTAYKVRPDLKACENKIPRL
jgi:uncharacterized RDD family membrane protein YckC